MWSLENHCKCSPFSFFSFTLYRRFKSSSWKKNHNTLNVPQCSPAVSNCVCLLWLSHSNNAWRHSGWVGSGKAVKPKQGAERLHTWLWYHGTLTPEHESKNFLSKSIWFEILFNIFFGWMRAADPWLLQCRNRRVAYWWQHISWSSVINNRALLERE